MTKILERALQIKYRNLFTEDIEISCEDGWYDLIDTLSCCIENYRDTEGYELVLVTCIKEKFGGLRYYCETDDNCVKGMIKICELLSYRICEKCGWSATPVNVRGTMKTYCIRCRGRNNEEKEQ